MRVIETKCIGCGKCVTDCFPGAITLGDKKAVIDMRRCNLCGHCVAICPTNAVTSDDDTMVDVVNYKKETFDIAPENLLNFIKFRRSIRKFKNQPVSNEDIKRIISAGRFTQTGGNAQDVSYVVVRDDLTTLKEMAYASLKQKGEFVLENPENYPPVVASYAKLWVRMYTKYQEDPQKNDKLFFNAPVIIIVTANSPVNGALASTNMELMTNAIGLGTFYSGFFIRSADNNAEIAKFLNLEEGKQIVTCLVVGHPDVKYVRTTPRKDAQIKWL